MVRVRQIKSGINNTKLDIIKDVAKKLKINENEILEIKIIYIMCMKLMLN